MKISNCCSAPIKENTDICSKCGEHCVEEEQDKAILRINDQEVELTKEQEREVQKILEKVYAEPEQSEEEGKEDWISEKMKEFDEIIKSRTCFGHIEDEDFEPQMCFRSSHDVEQFVDKVKNLFKSSLTQQKEAIEKEWREKIEERIKIAELCIDVSEKGQDLGGGFTPQEEMESEIAVKIALESLLEN